MIIAVLFIFGLVFGSFITALTWRMHEKKDWVSGRSQCEACGHQLGPADLVPLFSWLYLRGQCRYCKKKIPVANPLIEISLASVFALSYIFWPHPLEGSQWLLFIAWLASAVCLAALFVYDLNWMLLPNKLVYSALFFAVAGNLAFMLANGSKFHFLVSWVASVFVASGIFFILHAVSGGKWIGFGDVRLGLVTGTLLHDPGISFIMIFLASILGTLYILPSLITKRRGANARLPYGPFLILATALCLLFGQNLLDWYQNLVLI